MVRVIISIFLLLHGFVHLLYFGHSQRYFELQPGLTWPEDSWFFSNLFRGKIIRLIASISMVLVAIFFILAGVVLFFDHTWWHELLIIAISISSLFYILLWNGKMNQLPDQGLVGILINLSFIVFIFILNCPTVNL